MKNYTIYTCGKMSGLTLSEQMNWRLKIEKAVERIKPENVTVTFIHPPFYYNYEYDSQRTQQEIKRWELGVVRDKCDIVVVNLDGINDSVGSHYEIATVDAIKDRFIPVIGIGDPEGVHRHLFIPLICSQKQLNGGYMTEKVILYSTGCPKCKVLKNKLEAKNITYTENTDIVEMQSLGMMSAPALMVGDELLDFGHAVTWANNQ